MFSTGTGIAPFASLIRDPDTYERYERVILTHTCRQKAELSYGMQLIEKIKNDPLVGDMVNGKLLHLTTLTREEHPLNGRITDLIKSGGLFKEIGLHEMRVDKDRAMICGSKDMIDDTANLMKKFDLREGSNSIPAEFVIEKSFVG
jgi:ferredoxin--NADP+ reductase